MSTWVFGYGSLVSPASTAETIGRVVGSDDDYGPALLDRFGRRWNYGSLRQRATWSGPFGRVEGGIVVSLGIEAAPAERTNGSVVRVDGDELARLDRRESDYDRVDVTSLITSAVLPPGATVMTYVPRASAIERYVRSRDERRGAVRQGYVDLVRQAFADLGVGELDRYHATTPDPDVPTVPFEARWLTDR